MHAITYNIVPLLLPKKLIFKHHKDGVVRLLAFPRLLISSSLCHPRGEQLLDLVITVGCHHVLGRCRVTSVAWVLVLHPRAAALVAQLTERSRALPGRFPSDLWGRSVW